MKRITRRAPMGRLLALLLCALMLAGMLPLCAATGEGAAGAGSLTVSLKADTYRQLPDGAEVSLALYRIGAADPASRAGWKINDDLADYGILAADTSSKLGDIAERLAGDIPGRYSGRRLQLSKGTGTFDALETGVYLVAMAGGPDGLVVLPTIVTIPARNPETLAVEYDYEITLKGSYAESTPEPTETPAPVSEPTPTPEPPTTRVVGQKVWVDDGNAHKTRPESITVQLLANGALVDARPNWEDTSSDTWSYAFEDLPAVDESGAPISYTVRELAVDNYETSVSGTTITNTLVKKPPEEYTELSGAKTWKDGGNADGVRPTHIIVHLLRDGEEVERRVVTTATGWRYSFGSQPVDDGYGNKYTYTVREEAVSGYFTRVKGLNVTNSRLPGKPRTPTTPRIPPTRKTNTPPPKFEEHTAEELDELIDLLDYNTPLWGGLLGTGDDTPIWPYAFAGVGALAVIALLVLGKRRKRAKR